MKECFGGFALGVLLGTTLACVMIEDIYELGVKASKQLEKCQSQLPRDQFCEVIAKPEEVKNNE